MVHLCEWRGEAVTRCIACGSLGAELSFIMHPHAFARRVLNDSRPRDGAAVTRRAMSLNGTNFTNFSDIVGDFDNFTDSYAVDEIIEHIAGSINFYYTPFLIVLGTIGNFMSVYVFFNTKLRMQSTSQYLSALAISDTLFLCQLLPPWLHALRVTGVFHRQGFCQVFVYLSYVTCCISSWLVVAFTVERFVAVLYPLQRNALCTVTRARYIIAGVVLASLLINVPVLRFAIPTNNDCNIDYEYISYAAKFNVMDAVVSFSVPLVVIVIMNVWIVVGVWRLERDRHLLMKAEHVTVRSGQTSTSPGQSTPVGRLRPSRISACPRSQQKVTRMLLIVSSVFVGLNLPAYSMRLIAYAYGMHSMEGNNSRWLACQHLATMFFNTNFGINFLLYCLSGQNFRRALIQAIPCWRHKARRGVAVRRATTFHQARASSVSTSFVSNVTEATNYPAVAHTPTASRRRRREPTFITRWTFDNSRQRAATAQEQLEMRTYPAAGEM